LKDGALSNRGKEPSFEVGERREDRLECLGFEEEQP
jgi:hypothetical protein